MLLCVASTPLSRVGGFPGPDDALDEAGLKDAAACHLPSRFGACVMRSPARAAAETAKAISLVATTVAALADIDAGDWSGRSFHAIEAADPGALPAWLDDPTRGTPGGETMVEARKRIAGWLDGIAAMPGPVCAITHPMTIRAVLAQALALPLPSTLAIDVAPLSQVMLSFAGKWRLQSLGLR